MKIESRKQIYYQSGKYTNQSLHAVHCFGFRVLLPIILGKRVSYGALKLSIDLLRNKSPPKCKQSCKLTVSYDKYIFPTVT